jgi:hypothetical protein
MKKIIAAVFIMLLIPIGYLGAEDKQTLDPKKDKISMSSGGYLSIPAKQAYYIFKERMAKETKKADFLDCIEGQRRLIRYGGMSTGNEQTKPYQRYHSTFWVTIQCGK